MSLDSQIPASGVEQPTRGKRWVAVAADWPSLERGGKTEDEAVEKADSELEDLLTPAGLVHHRDRYVQAMRAWYAEGKPLGKWTIPTCCATRRITCWITAWEMQDRDLTDDASAR